MKKYALAISGALAVILGVYLDGASIREILVWLLTISGLIAFIVSVAWIADDKNGKI